MSLLSEEQRLAAVSPVDPAAAEIRKKLLTAAGTALAFVLFYLLFHIQGDWQYAVARRLSVVGAVAVAGGATAVATVIFQTVTHNRLLTPSIVGLESLYVLLQTGVVFFFGAAWADTTRHFLLSAGALALFGGGLYGRLLRTERLNVYLVLLVGLVAGVFFQSLSSFLQMLIDPNEFLVVQSRLFASFNNVSPRLLAVGGAAAGATIVWLMPALRYLDVLALGRDHAVNLGVDYSRLVGRLWIGVVLLTAVATALVGPVTFLGLLAANIARQLLPVHRHPSLLPAAVLVAVGLLAGALVLVERIFVFSVPVSVVVNFAGGAYFLYLVLKESQL